MTSDFTKKLLILSKIKGIGRAKLKEFSTDGMFFKVPLEELSEAYPELSGFRPPSTTYRAAVASATEDLETCDKNNDQIYSYLDSGYPALLKRCSDAPALLFVRGKNFSFSDRSIAVIGTREPTESGVVVGERITAYFAANGWTIVSGLALGLDTIAHKACLSAGGTTVAVLAHGLNHLAPKSNQSLAREIIDRGGALVSEYSYQTAPFASNFVERDRIQAGLSKGTIVVQTDVLGGSLHACRSSLKYGRFVFAPIPTQGDRDRNEPKIQGILRLLYGTPEEKMKMLQCIPSQLTHMLPICGRSDYPDVEEMLDVHSL